jgi:HPt (histidine-containing phosphotransfer) domain-containing protein
MQPADEDPAVAALQAQFFERSHDDLETMHGALDAGGHDVIARLAHRMAGAAGLFGLDPLAHAARQLQKSAEAADKTDVRRLLGETAARLGEARAACRPR